MIFQNFFKFLNTKPLPLWFNQCDELKSSEMCPSLSTGRSLDKHTTKEKSSVIFFFLVELPTPSCQSCADCPHNCSSPCYAPALGSLNLAAELSTEWPLMHSHNYGSVPWASLREDNRQLPLPHPTNNGVPAHLFGNENLSRLKNGRLKG